MPTYEHLLYEKHGGVALLTMNRPEIMNALEAALARDLVSALREAAADDEIGSIVLTGTGKSFSSGGDLGRLMQGFDLLEGRRWLQEGYAQLMGLLKVRKPVIAAVNGYAVGAGFSLALLCDLIIAADTAKFGMAFIKVGAVPDCGALYFLPRLVGLPKAKELVFTGANIDAAEAYRIGIVNRVVPAAELLPESAPAGAAAGRRSGGGPGSGQGDLECQQQPEPGAGNGAGNLCPEFMLPDGRPQGRGNRFFGEAQAGV